MKILIRSRKVRITDMVIVSLKRLMISLLLLIIVTLLIIIGGLKMNGGTDWYAKIEPQNFLFWGITALVIQIWISGTLLFNHKKLLNNIRRLSAFEDMNSINAEKSFKELGILGEELKKVLKRENQLSVMRSNRISALNNLASMLCDGYSEPVIVTDVKGLIITISNKLKTRLVKETDNTNFTNITEIRADIKLPEILGFMEKQRTVWENPESSGLVCTPVFDKNNTIQFCIWEFETSFFAGKLKELNQQKSKIKPSYKRLKDYVIPFFQRKKK